MTTIQRLTSRVMILVPALAVLGGLGWIGVPGAHAVPSFSRQTGYPCMACHTTPPELTPLGRLFKLNGYTIAGGMPTIKVKSAGEQAGLDLLQSLPLSVVFDTSFTAVRTAQPGTQNGSFELPQDASLFLAGAWAQHVGSFVQVTYSGADDHFSWDNTDIRYSNSGKLGGKDIVYGITFNNNPSVEDLWNDTPAWGFPWVNSDVAVSPSAAALVNGSLAQDVAGIGGYGMWDDHFYFAGTIYRSNHIGGPQPPTGAGFGINIRGVAPYWRFAWQQTSKNNYLEVGTYGMDVRSSPMAVTGPEDDYTDWAVDFQYDRTLPQFDNDILSLRGTYIRENSTLAGTLALGGASFLAHNLNTLQANAEYHFGDRYAATFGWFSVTGTTDPLLYASAPVTGSADGDPHSDGFLTNFAWWPMQNIQVVAQYTKYLRFNGLVRNYDGAGRNAADNDAIYLLTRFLF